MSQEKEFYKNVLGLAVIGPSYVTSGLIAIGKVNRCKI